jgi:heptosyltransferase-3
MNCEFKNIHKILVIKLRHIGDVLLSIPVFRALRETFPDADLSALVNCGTEEILKGNPLVDEIISFNRDIKRLPLISRTLGEMDFLKQIRKRGFDMTVDLTGGDRAALLSYLSGARYRIGWKDRKGFTGKKYLYTHLSKPDSGRHMVLQNLDIVRARGIDTKNLSVDFHIPVSDRAFVRNILKKHRSDEFKAVVHIHPTSRWLFKCWKDEYMAEVIRWLLAKGIFVIMTSSPDERELEKSERILALFRSNRDRQPSAILNLCGKTSIKQLGAISEASALFFGVDSAPMHIAAAVGTPVVALFGPTGAHNWGPWDNESSRLIADSFQMGSPYPQRNGIRRFGIHTIIQRDWDCVPCGKDGCDGSKQSRCLDGILMTEVEAVLAEKLQMCEPVDI